MKVRALKSFPYTHDGISTSMVAAGDEPDIRDELVPGLRAAGLVEPAKPSQASPVQSSPSAAMRRAPETTAITAAPEIKPAPSGPASGAPRRRV